MHELACDLMNVAVVLSLQHVHCPNTGQAQPYSHIMGLPLIAVATPAGSY